MASPSMRMRATGSATTTPKIRGNQSLTSLACPVEAHVGALFPSYQTPAIMLQLMDRAGPEGA
jgi:hypothetical protein